jgi:Lamin Tail Domain
LDLYLLFISKVQVVVNEVGDTGTVGTCGGNNSTGAGGADWIEIQNRGTSVANITGFKLYDSDGPTAAYTFPATNTSVLQPNEIRLLCRQNGTSFNYGIGGTDTITLADASGTVISTTGVLLGLSSATTSIQLLNDNSGKYEYAPATPGLPNVFPPPDVVINEVADKDIPSVCTPAGDYIELYNRLPSTANISGWILRDDQNATYNIPSNTTIAPYGYILFCRNQFPFGIGGDDTITLYNPSNVAISTSGKLQSLGSLTLTYSRRPNGSFSYTAPSPNSVNVFFSPLFGTLFVNEVASTSAGGVCGTQDWIELYHSGNTTLNASGLILHDDAGPSNINAFRFPPSFVFAPFEIRLLCGNAAGSFQFGIAGDDTITIINSDLELVSTTGILPNLGTATATYQLRDDRKTYQYAPPTPNATNVFPASNVVVNEVADKTIPNSPCAGDYIELYNDSPTNANISGWRLQDDTNNTYILPSNATIASYGYLLFCEAQFIFGINGVDTITLYDGSNVVRSTTGKLLNLGSPTLTYSRRPNGNYSYTKPSPNAVNIFFSTLTGTVFVNEVANTGVAGVCSGQDWIELINTGATAVDLSGSILHDDNGPNGAEAFTFPLNSSLAAGEIRLLCGSFPGSFQFGINGVDTITLIDSNRELISTTGVLLNLGTATSTYQRRTIPTLMHHPHRERPTSLERLVFQSLMRLLLLVHAISVYVTVDHTLKF